MKESIREAILAALKAARDIAEKADTENRDLTEDERGEVTAFMKKAQTLKASSDNDDALRKSLSDLTDGIGLLPPSGGDKPMPADFARPSKRKSLGESFIDSPEFKALIASVPEGRFGEKARVQSQPYGVKALVTGVSDSSAGALVYPQLLGLLDPNYARPLTVRSLFSPGTTTTDTIEYVKVLGVTNAAAPVAEATTHAAPTSVDAGGALVNAAGGGYKPESAITFEKATTNVKTIAHWIPATKRSLSDAAQVKTLIDTFLLYGLEEELEDQLITGTGVGENLLGINATSGIQTQIAPAGAETVFDVTRKARTKVELTGRARPSAFVLNPIDWQNIELMKDGNERYYGAGPFGLTSPALWGLPVVQSEAVTAGTAWVADWKTGVIWDREQASIQITDSHADFFVRNLVAILAEMRCAFALLRPAAFCKIALA